MLKEPKRIIAEEPQSPDRWLREPRNNHETPEWEENEDELARICGLR